MPADGEVWEVAELITALDPGIAGRLLAVHPATGWCARCRTPAPCTSHRLAAYVQRRQAATEFS